MKFLVDNQLPPALATHLALQDVVSQHVSAVGLDQASDRDIWIYAATNGFIIVSKDEDFLHLSIADPGGPKRDVTGCGRSLLVKSDVRASDRKQDRGSSLVPNELLN